MAENEHEHGSTDMREHYKTFDLFLRTVAFSFASSIVVLIVLAIFRT